jgi:hypothetical protein
MDGVQYRGSTTSAVSNATSPMHPRTPESRAQVSHVHEGFSTPTGNNPFSTRSTSRPTSSLPSSSSTGRSPPSRYFHSRRVQKGDVEQPWLKKIDPKEKWVTIIPLIGLFLGLGIAGFLVYDGIRSVVHHKYCLVMSDDFSDGFNGDIWTKEAEVGGFG